MRRGIWLISFVLFARITGFAQETTPEAIRLAARLTALKTDADRNELLKAENIQPTAPLFWALRQGADEIFNKADYSQALPIYSFVLSLAEGMQDRSLRSSALYSIAGVKNAMSDYEESAALFTQTLIIERSIGDPARIERRLGNLADVERKQGNYAPATEHILEALALARGRADKLAVAKHTNMLAIVQEANGDYRSALETYNQSLSVAEELKEREGIAFVSNNIGALYLAQGDLQLAAQYVERSLKIKEEIGNKTAIVNGLINLGDIYHRLGQDAVASAHLQRGLQLAQAEGNKWGMAGATLNLATVQRSLGHLDEARDGLRSAVQMGEAIGAKPLVARALQSIAEIENEKGDYRASASAGERAVGLARDLAEPDLISLAATAAGRANLRLGNRDQARAEFAEAIATIEDMRSKVAGGDLEQQVFFGSRILPYHEMVGISLSDGHPGRALEFAERAKARVILDAVSRNRTSVTKTMSPAEKSAEQDLRARTTAITARISQERQNSKPDRLRLADLGKRLDSARLAYTAFENTLYAAHPELRIQRFEAAAPMATEISARLRKWNCAAIEFVVTETTTYALVITPGSTVPQVFRRQIPAAEIKAKVRRFRDRLAARDLGFHESAIELYRLLLEPASAGLRHVTKLAIIADGPLWELPFAALENRPDHFLIQDYDVFYAQSLAVLSAMIRRTGREAANNMPTLLALGNPTGSNLPHAANEVEALGPIYGAAQSRIYTGSEARKDRFQAEAGKYRILHLAAHGVIDDHNPMYSYVSLAGSGSKTGSLEARDMMDLDLHADLVVLSGCETARGEASTGEGIIGMAWALFIAGSSATMASSWKVDSESTMELMIEFHRNLRSTARPPEHSGMSGALRAAMLQVMSQPEYRHPYFWAGFSLVGQVF